MPDLFIYGTLKNSKVQKQIIGRLVPGQKNALTNYRIDEIQIENQNYPTLVPKKHSIITGQTITLSKEELKKVDEYETNAYKRIEVTLESGKKAFTYIKRLRTQK